MKVLSLYAWNYIKKLLHFIGRINTFVILSIFYFAAFFPVKAAKTVASFISKKPNPNSYWIKRTEPIDPATAKFQF